MLNYLLTVKLQHKQTRKNNTTSQKSFFTQTAAKEQNSFHIETSPLTHFNQIDFHRPEHPNTQSTKPIKTTDTSNPTQT